MSSSKNTKPSAKKDAKAKKPEKKTAPAKAVKQAPAAKKAAPAAADKKSAGAKKATPATKKEVAKKAPAAKAPATKQAATKASGKAAPAKAAPAPAKKAPAPKAAAAAKQPAKSASASSKTSKPSKPEKVTEVKAEKKEIAAKPQKQVKPEPAAVEVPSKPKANKDEKKLVVATALLLVGKDGKLVKPIKTIMFTEVKEDDEKVNQKKVSSELKQLEKKPTASIRHKHSLAEETQEELTERILKELEEQNLAFTREAATQMCTRCNRNLVSPEFWVDKHLGYCEDCAAILKLGQSKEARKVEYQIGAMGGDSLDEADEDGDFMSGPDAAALKEAEEELEDLDD